MSHATNNTYPKLSTEYFVRYDGRDRYIEYYSVWCRVTADGHTASAIEIRILDGLNAEEAEKTAKARNAARA